MSTQNQQAAESNPRQESAQPLPRLAYTPAQAAQVLGVCQETIYRLLKRGLLRSSSALRTKLIPHRSIEEFLTNTLS